LDHKTGTGHHHIIGDCVQVGIKQRQQDDRQVALQKLLLIDSKQHLAVTDCFQHFGGEVEGSELDIANQTSLLQGFQSRGRAGRAQGQHTINIGIGRERGRDSLLSIDGITQVNGQNLNHATGGFSQSIGEALAAQPEIPVTFILYFSTGTTRLTKKSLKLVPEIIATIEERKSKDISVTGHTDSVGSDRLNRRLSFRRAKHMAGILADKGINPSILEITYHGEGNPLVPTPDGVAEPRNRRVEVTIR